MTKQIKTYKASELYTKLYGRKAYLAWMDREAEIDKLMKDKKRYSVAEIVRMREVNFRKMKLSEQVGLEAMVCIPAQAA